MANSCNETLTYYSTMAIGIAGDQVRVCKNDSSLSSPSHTLLDINPSGTKEMLGLKIVGAFPTRSIIWDSHLSRQQAMTLADENTQTIFVNRLCQEVRHDIHFSFRGCNNTNKHSDGSNHRNYGTASPQQLHLTIVENLRLVLHRENIQRLLSFPCLRQVDYPSPRREDF